MADRNNVRPKTIAGSRRRRPHVLRPRGTVTTLTPDGLLQTRGNTAAGELVVESSCLRWRRGACS